MPSQFNPRAGDSITQPDLQWTTNDAQGLQNEPVLNKSSYTESVDLPLSVANGGTGNTTGQPSGTAGGDLSGSYPSPTVTKLNGSALTASGYGLTGTHPAEAVSLTTASNALASDVALTNTGTFFDGPSMAQGTSGKWVVHGTVTLIDTSGATSFTCRLWDGLTVIASTVVSTAGANQYASVHLSGQMTNPTGNIKISVNDALFTTGKIYAGTAGVPDSTIFGERIA